MKSLNLLSLLGLVVLSQGAFAQAKLGDTQLTSADFVVSGAAAATPAGIKVAGGHVTLLAAKQKELTAAIGGKPFTLAATLSGKAIGTALTLGPITIGRVAGQWTLASAGAKATVGKDESLRIVVVADGSTLRAFSGGKIAGSLPYKGSSALFSAGSPAAEKTKWQGMISDLEILPRSVMPQEAAEMSASQVAAGRSAVVEAEVTQFTTVPEPASVLPYKHALITQEYVVKEIKSGSLAGVKVGSRIRVARWGIRSGAKTAIKDLKKGSRVTLTLGLFADYPTMEREFTVDKLAEAFDLPYLLDTEKTP